MHPSELPERFVDLPRWAEGVGISCDSDLYKTHETRLRLHDPVGFIYSMPHERPAVHHRLILDRIAQVVRDRTVQVLDVNAPPGSAKTQTMVAAIAWALALDPSKEHILICNSEELAERTARKVRALVASREWKVIARYSGVVGEMTQVLPSQRDLEIDTATRAASRFILGAGGGLLATGVGSTLLGMRATGALWLDDLIRGYEEAANDARMEKLREQIFGDFFTRCSGHFSVVHIGQRLGYLDTTGILSRHFEEQNRNAPEGERIYYQRLVLRLICEEGDPFEPAELDRKPGGVLWPEMFKGALLANAQASGPHIFSTRYQQHGGSPNVAFVNEEHLLHDAHLSGERMDAFLCGDLAAGVSGGDATVLMVVGARRDWKTRMLHLHLLFVWRAQADPHTAMKAALTMSEKYGVHRWVFENDAYARSMRSCMSESLRVANRPVTVELLSTHGTKLDRAAALRGLLWNKQVHLPPRGMWPEVETLRMELLQFGRVSGVGVDDMVDALAVITRKIGVEGYIEAPVNRDMLTLPNGDKIMSPHFDESYKDRREDETDGAYFMRQAERARQELLWKGGAVEHGGRAYIRMPDVDDRSWDSIPPDDGGMRIW